MRIGIFGGTFDPPHLAHLILASEAQAQLRLERILWVLTPFPPHKTSQYLTSLPLRLEMLAAALRGNASFEISRVDIDRPPPHYAADTLRLLRGDFPDDELVYLMGGDSLRDLPKWHTPHAFLANCDSLGVMQRPGVRIDWDELERHLPNLRERVIFFSAPQMKISSCLIRKKVASREHFRYYLPAAVYALIVENGLYLETGARAG